MLTPPLILIHTPMGCYSISNIRWHLINLVVQIKSEDNSATWSTNEWQRCLQGSPWQSQWVCLKVTWTLDTKPGCWQALDKCCSKKHLQVEIQCKYSQMQLTEDTETVMVLCLGPTGVGIVKLLRVEEHFSARSSCCSKCWGNLKD